MKKWKEFIKLLIGGFTIGFGNVIPGLSGGTLALIMGIYDKLINAISHLRKNFKQSMGVLIPVVIGVAIAFLSLSHAVTYCLTNFLFPTIMLFFGAIVGALPMLFREEKGIKFKPSYAVVAFLACAAVVGSAFLPIADSMDLTNLNFLTILLLFVSGAVAAAAMVVPGLSGSALLMTFGFYTPIMNQVKALTTSGTDKLHAVAILVPCGIGILCGIFGIAKVIEYCLKKHYHGTYWAIIGFVIGSGFAILYTNFFASTADFSFADVSWMQYVAGIITLALGIVGTMKLGDKNKEHDDAEAAAAEAEVAEEDEEIKEDLEK